jgi:hypothetical protein
MLTLEIKNKEIEEIFKTDFFSNQENFFSFFLEKYKEEKFYKSLDKSCKEVHETTNKKTLDELINELENN